MSTVALSFIAGNLSAFSPCVLPTFPLIAGGALQNHRYGPVALAAGLTLSFTVVGVTLNAAGSVLHFDGEVAGVVAALSLIVFGLLMISSRLKSSTTGVTNHIANFANRLLTRINITGLRGQFLIGTLLGAVWMPCAGPALGAAMTLAAQGENIIEASFSMLLFGLGATVPLLAVAYGAKRAFMGKSWIASLQKNAQLVFGIILLTFGVLNLTGGDKALEAYLLSIFPDWLIGLTTKF